MFTEIFTSILAFSATNLDDLFILILFYGTKRYTSSEIVLGQYLGIATLLIISLAISLLGYFIDLRYIGLMGLFPIFLAAKELSGITKLHSSTDEESGAVLQKTGVLALAGVTIANGGDNIGVYVPLLSTFTLLAKIWLILVFALMIYIWCVIAKYLAGHPWIAATLKNYGEWVMPVVLIFLGFFILYTSKSLTLFF